MSACRTIRQKFLGADTAPQDIHDWRDRLLTAILMVALVMGSLTAVPSIFQAWKEGQTAIAVVDFLALAWVVFIWRKRGLSFHFRAWSLLLALYAVGLVLLVSIGPVSQIYLMAFPLMAALLLGLRGALFVSSLIAISCATLLQGLERSLDRVKKDVAAREMSEAALRANDARWKLALESTGDGVWDCDLKHRKIIFSDRFKEMCGYEPHELPEDIDALDQHIHPEDLPRQKEDRQAHLEGLTPTYANEHRVRCKDGSWKWFLTRGLVISRDEHGKPLRMIGTHTDITNRKHSEALIWQQANYDGLTGLPNREMLRDRLEQDIKKCKRDGQSVAVMFIDLDHFKEVNDTLGHDHGDLLLVEAAHRIRHCVRESDTVARLGGDEFTVVLPELDNLPRVEQIAQDIIAVLAEVFQLGNERAYVSASIGITFYPDDATEIEDLFKQADQAMYVAKDAGRSRFSYFTPALQEAAQTRVRLTNDLRQALTDEQFRVFYQPIVELQTGRVHKAEALIRWQHPTRGLVSPAIFIPIAESSGLINEIGDWVFRESAAQIKHWRGQYQPDFQISVNKSPVQFRSEDNTLQAWLQHLRELGLPGQSMVVEITEGLLLEANADVSGQLNELRQAGIGVSLDDFGTGYSSLSYLQKFDIDFLKIDQTFVRGLAPASKNLALCKAIIVMAHELGMLVVAEGVETAEQRALLTEAGCDYGQGYHFAKPMPAEDFEGWYSARQLALTA